MNPRTRGALAGFIGGAILGLLVLMIVMIATASNFGLTNIFIGSKIGASIGLIYGLLFPQSANRVLSATIGFSF